MKTGRWFSDKPPALPGQSGAEKHVFLVEFWATWCPQCLKSIPHLGELQKKHGKHGLVVIGISNEEASIIKGFKNKMKMEYHVGQDDDMQTNNAWCDDIEFIPFAYLVDKAGTIVWRGNPTGDADVMDRAVRDVLAGKFDVEKAKLEAAREQKFAELMDELHTAYIQEEKERIPEIADEMIALKPDALPPYQIKRMYLLEKNQLEELRALEAKMEEALKESPSALFELVDIELKKELGTRSPGLLLRSAMQLNKLRQRRDPEALALLARVQCEMGLIDEAIECQRQAVALADEKSKGEARRILAYYEGVKDAAQAHRLAIAKGMDKPD